MKNRSKSSASAVSSDKGLIFTDELSFAALEAYKLLRTNIMFSFPGDASCRVVGISSSVRGEGKSTTACNLAYVLSQAGKKTLLIDGDLRLPSVFTKRYYKLQIRSGSRHSALRRLSSQPIRASQLRKNGAAS